MESVLLWGATKGKGSGVGESVAKSLIAKDKLVILAGRNEQKLLKLSSEVGYPADSQYTFVSGYPLDPILYQNILEKHNIRTVISFIGVGYAEALPFLDDTLIADMVQSNFLVNLDIIKKSIIPLKRRHSTIIIANSIVGMLPHEGSSVYTASKFALRGLIESARIELREFNVGLCSLYFQNVKRAGMDSLVDCILTASKNAPLNFDFVIS
jgi:short-subunit dehydrogenase